MNNYTESDYKRIYAELERKEQESIKAYNTWLMQVKMSITTYNSVLQESGLTDKFELIKATSDEEIESLDKKAILEIYERIRTFREETKDTIEIALGLKEGEVKRVDIVQEVPAPEGFDDFDGFEEDDTFSI